MSIRVRLAIACAAATLVIFTVAGLLFLRSFHRGLETQLDPGLRVQADSLTARVRSEGANLDLAARTDAVRTNDVVAQVLTGSGRVVTATREAGPAAVVDGAVIRRMRGQATVARLRLGGEREPFRVLVRPVPGDPSRITVVATSLEGVDEAVDRVRAALLAGGGFAVLLAGIGAWFLARAALRPVERMRQEAAAISENDRAGRLRVPGTHDEIAALGITMNDLLARLQRAMTRQRAFVADAGHELRTPLAILSAELELADRPYRTRDDLAESIRQANSETARLRHLADELMFLVRCDDGTQPLGERESLRSVLEVTVSALRARAEQHDVSLNLTVADEIDGVEVDPASFRRALENLLENSFRYAPPGSAISVMTRAGESSVRVEVSDDGPGFPPEFLPLAFERFRRSDESRARADGGTGLGLAIVLAVAQDHGGDATAENRVEGGARVTVRIPRR